MKQQRYHGSPSAVKQRARELRQEMTQAEVVLWARLRNRGLGSLKFRRQHPIGSFVVDFYCDRFQLVVEIDGAVHDGQQARDEARTAWLTERGYQIVRFRNEEVLENLSAVLEKILAACRE